VPLFILFKWYGLINTLFALSLIGATTSLPLNTWFAIQYFNTIPKELEESAMIDGCNRIQLLLKIFLPLAAPALISMSIITFLATWNEFILAVIFLNKAEIFTFTVALVTYGTIYQGAVDFGFISAGIIIGLLPVLLIFTILHKYLITGLTRGAIKA
jgi:multiple sugar transport system permease protein